MHVIDQSYELCLRTNYVQKDFIEGKKKHIKIEIFPIHKPYWEIIDVSVMLNTLLSDWTNEDRTPRILKIDAETNGKIALYTFVSKIDSSHKVHFHINTLKQNIDAIATINWLKDYWVKETIKINTNVGSQKRIRKSQHNVDVFRFTICIPINDRITQAIIKEKSTDFYSQKMFSHPYNLFVSTLKHFDLFYGRSTFMARYYNSYIDNKKRKYEKSETKFKRDAQGYIKFILTDELSDSFDSIIVDGNKYSVVNGIYITPYTVSILKNNPTILNGLMLDTTWKVMYNYVTSILVASVCNVSVPLGFSFGKSETKDEYQLLFSFFKSKLNIDLSNYIIESDQGSALKSVCSDNSCIHLACLRHLLVSLKYDEFSYDAAKLVKAKSMTDFEVICNILSERYKNISDEKTFAKLLKTLDKIGLTFYDDAIHISNTERWNSVSQIQRVHFKMPSTTNALESIHGHINSMIPRRNEFWNSLYRLIKYFLYL